MNMLALTILLPLIGFVLLAFSRGRWSENLSAAVGMGSVGWRRWSPRTLASTFSLTATGGQRAAVDPMSVGDFNIGFNPVLDGLSLTMLSVVTGVGFLIHMFASRTCAVKRIFPLLRLYQPVYRQHGGSGTGR